MSTRPVHDGLFTSREDGTARLLGGRCRACARCHFPRAVVCPYCSAGDGDPVELGPSGTLWLFTAVLQAPPGYHGAVPFGFGVVDLAEGLRVVARLTEADPTKLVAGQSMRLVTELLYIDAAGANVSTYAFAPAGDE